MNCSTYTVKEFSLKSGLSPEYIRQACRGYTDSNGKKSKLPHGYEAKKIYDTWVIEEKKWYRSYMPFPIDDLPFKEKFPQYLDLNVIHDPSLTTPVYLLNLFDFYGPDKEAGVFMDISGDYLLYLVYKLLQQKLLKDTDQFTTTIEKLNSIFIENLDLLALWLFESGKSLYFNRHIYTKKLVHCLRCGQQLVNKSPSRYVFCNDIHYDDFYKRKTSVFLLLTEIPALYRADLKYILSDQYSSTYSEIHELHDKFLKAAKVMVRIITSKQLPIRQGVYKDSLYKQIQELISANKKSIKDKLKQFVDIKTTKEKEIVIRELVEEKIIEQLRLHQRPLMENSPIYFQLIYDLIYKS